MGYSSYSVTDRTIRASSVGYFSKSKDEIFTQQKEQKIHPDMDPKGVSFRVCNDSLQHPNTIPIQLYLDVTGSMGHIPHDMIKDGLPKLMSSLIQNGIPDASLMFGAIGDHESDKFPLQVAQFESGDEELDTWLTRTYIEGNGGGNAGESYPLAWYFAAKHVKTQCFDNRNSKGFVFTIGDEPFLNEFPGSAITKIIGDAEVANSYTAAEFLAEAQKKNHVYHIFVEHGFRKCNSAWNQLLGENLIVISDYTTISRVISDIILKHVKPSEFSPLVSDNTTPLL